MSLVYKENIIALSYYRKTFLINPRVKQIIIICNNTVAEKSKLKTELIGAEPVFFLLLLLSSLVKQSSLSSSSYKASLTLS
jgi:hypothetical protein